MPSLHRNNATSTLLNAVVASDTTFVVQSGHGARFPAPSGGDFFWLTIQNGATVEIVRCTARAGDSLTVLRGQDNTSAQDFAAGSSVEMRLTAGWQDNVIQKDGVSALQGRNLIINGNPIINQRGYVSGTPTGGANQYTLDRWRVVASGQSVAWTDSGGIRTVTAPAGGMEQVIEGASILGGVHTVSWVGTATALVNGSPVANGGQVTLPGGTNATVRLSGGTWSRLQVEAGNVASQFERRPVGIELMLCQRYYWQTDAPIQIGGTMLTGIGPTVWQAVVYPVPMRASPAVAPTFSAGTGNASQAVNNIGRSSAQVQLTGNGANNGGFAVTLNAGCSFSAEF